MATDNVDASVLAARAQLKGHFSEFSGEKRGEGWQKLWEAGDFLPWDRGIPNPALTDLLQDRKDLLSRSLQSDDGDKGQKRRKTAFVPGCGRGVDVLLLRAFGYDAVGLEVSRDAVKACLVHEEEHGGDEVYKTRNEEIGQGTAKFVVGDFFGNEWVREGVPETFDLIYDYTFFCAIEPAFRPRWASRMAELLGQNGSLVCLEFPTYKSVEAGGPPFAAPPEAYLAHLSGLGVEVDQQNSRGSTAKGLERVAHFHPVKTHQMGMDEEGRVRDYVSVWQQPESQIR